MQRTRILSIILFFFLVPFSVHALDQKITEEAQRIYQEHQNSVYQIRVIDLSTGKKSAIGSGFQFSDEGHIATNYHVLADAIHRPEHFRVEYIRHDGSLGGLKVLDVDVIHDVAIVQSVQPDPSYINLGESSLLKGTRLFSLGNPLDLGMTIIEGTYNGLMEKSLYRKILFSGSLNSGMSGGPVVNRDGHVIGINVSTAGNQVSFLVPVEYLKELYHNILKNKPVSPFNWYPYIEQQLIDNQERYMELLFSSKWETLPIGEAIVPGEILNVFKCWGKSEDKENELYNYAFINCSSEEEIFLSTTLSTGKIIYKYNWVNSKGLNSIRFYKLYENFFSYPHNYVNAQREDATNFKCTTNFVDIAQEDMKVSLCARNYKKYPKLYDINLAMASVNQKDRGLLVEVVALGVSKDRALDFMRKFMKEIKW